MKTKRVVLGILTVVVVLSVFLGAAGDISAEDNAGFLEATTTATGSTSLHVDRFILGGQVWRFNLVYTGTNGLALNLTDIELDPCFAQTPAEVWPTKMYENNPLPTPSSAYNGAIAWVTILPAKGASTTAQVTVASLELRHRLNGSDYLSFGQFTSSGYLWGFKMPLQYYRTASAWCEDPSNSNCKGVHLAQGTDYNLSGNSVILNVQPGYIYHFWNTIDMGEGSLPRWHYPANHSAQYYARSNVSIQGPAVYSLGIDYWNEVASGTPSSAEAANSFWGCAAQGFQEVKAGAYR